MVKRELVLSILEHSQHIYNLKETPPHIHSVE